jgi:hypothetical protein
MGMIALKCLVHNNVIMHTILLRLAHHSVTYMGTEVSEKYAVLNFRSPLNMQAVCPDETSVHIYHPTRTR